MNTKHLLIVIAVLFALLLSVGFWFGYAHIQKGATGLDVPKEAIIKADNEVKTTNSEKAGSDTLHDGGSSKIVLFQFGCEDPSCLVMNTINPKTLQSEGVQKVASGYLKLYGTIDGGTSYIVTVSDDLIVLDTSSSTNVVTDAKFSKEALGFTENHEIISVKSSNKTLYVLAAQPKYPSGGLSDVAKTKVVKISLGEKSTTTITLPAQLQPHSIYSNFVGSNESYLYLASPDPKEPRNVIISTLDTATNQVIESKLIDGVCDSEDQEPSTPCSKGYDEMKKFGTYACGESLISRVFTQDGSNVLRIQNQITNMSTTTQGIFGMCVTRG